MNIEIETSDVQRRCSYQRKKADNTLTGIDGALVHYARCSKAVSADSPFCHEHRQYGISKSARRHTTVADKDFNPHNYIAVGSAPDLCKIDMHVLKDRVECLHCGSLMWPEESTTKKAPYLFNQCCQKGKLKGLLDLTNVNPPYRNLLEGNSPVHQEFKTHIRSYNMALAMASTLCNYNEQFANRSSTGVYSFVINGEIHHAVGSLSTNVNCRRFGNIYMFDGVTQLNRRMEIHPHLNSEMMEQLQSHLNNVNPYVSIYRHMGSLLESNSQTSSGFSLALLNSSTGNRTYELPTAAEFAMIVPDDAEEFTHQEALTIKIGHNNELNFIPRWHPLYDPLAYPLLFPEANAGWHPELSIQLNNRWVKPSCAEYHR